MHQHHAQSTELQRGYRVGNLRDLDPRFICAHCQLVLREPMQGDCGHRYCRNCVQDKFNDARKRQQESMCSACDPEDEPAEISPDRTYPDNAINREINKQLTVQCPNTPCDRFMQLKELEKHAETDCDFKPQPCNLCGQPFPAADLPDHMSNDCSKRMVPCDDCKESVVLESLADHKRGACIGSTVQCEYCLLRVKDDAIEHHWRSECPVGWHDKNPCPFGCTEMPEGWSEHRLKCQKVHIDRLRAAAARREAAAQQPAQGLAERKAVVASSSAGPRGAATATSAVPASELAFASSVDYELLHSLTDRARSIQQKLEAISMPPSAAREIAADDQGEAGSRMRDLQVALSQGDKLSELLDTVRNRLDEYVEKIRGYEQQMQRGSDRKLDMERRQQDLAKLLVYKNIKILDLEKRIDILEHSGCEGTLLWKIANFRQRREEARDGKVCSIFSPPFYTGKYGYKMCGRLYLNGDGAGKNTHISLFFIVMRGPFDALLPWPFAKAVTMSLLDQNFEGRHIVEKINLDIKPAVKLAVKPDVKPDASSPLFKRPTTEMNPGIGFPVFLPLPATEPSSSYVKDDTMFIKFVVDRTDLP